MAPVQDSQTPLFRHLLRSYSLISVLPLATVWIVLALWGNGLVVGYLRSAQEQSISRAVEATNTMLDRYVGIGWNLVDDQFVQRSLTLPDAEVTGEFELELYRVLYSAVAHDLSKVSVHITDYESRRVFSSGTFPDRYRLDDYRNRRDFVGSTDRVQSTRIVLNPRDGDEASRIVLSLWIPIPEGFVIIDIGNAALWERVDARSASQLYLVDRDAFRAYHVSQSGGAATFDRNPELGIAFGDQRFLRPTDDLLVSRRDVAYDDLAIVVTTDLTTYFDALHEILEVGALILAGIAAVVIVVSVRMSRTISRPIHGVVHAMSAYSGGPRPVAITDVHRKSDELYRLIMNYNHMVATIDDLIRTVREEEQAQRLAERRALESQIQPHFLYNTLGSIKSMAKLGDTAAVTSMVTDLGKMLRFLVSDTKTMVPLGESMDQVRRYLNIQKVRFGERLEVHIDLDPDTLSFDVPKLLVQPLVENAVLHGVESSSTNVEIRISTSMSQGRLAIRVEDNGPGFGDDVRGDDVPDVEPERGGWVASHGIGLRNVRDRLRLVYGARAMLTLMRKEDVTVALIRIEL